MDPHTASDEAADDADADPDTSAAEPGPVEPAPDRDIDVRFSYANERTFLAWNRTALALVTAGLAITQLLPPFNVPGGRRLIGMPLILLGTVIALASLRQWKLNERAMRAGEPLPPSPLPKMVAIVIGICAVIALILAAFAGSS